MNRPDAPCVDCVGHDKWQAAKPNNYDRVQAMTMEELAEKIGESIDCEVCKTMHHSESGECPCRPHQSCVDFWLDWLAETGGYRMSGITREEILERDFSEAFVRKMKNAIEMSYYKYGFSSKTYPVLAQAHKCIQERLDLYEKTHNKEYLVDIANFAMLEYMHPAFEDAKYIPQDSDKSPGLAGGISYKELMEG